MILIDYRFSLAEVGLIQDEWNIYNDPDQISVDECSIENSMISDQEQTNFTKKEISAEGIRNRVVFLTKKQIDSTEVKNKNMLPLTKKVLQMSDSKYDKKKMMNGNRNFDSSYVNMKSSGKIIFF